MFFGFCKHNSTISPWKLHPIFGPVHVWLAKFSSQRSSWQKIVRDDHAAGHLYGAEIALKGVSEIRVKPQSGAFVWIDRLIYVVFFSWNWNKYEQNDILLRICFFFSPHFFYCNSWAFLFFFGHPRAVAGLILAMLLCLPLLSKETVLCSATDFSFSTIWWTPKERWNHALCHVFLLNGSIFTSGLSICYFLYFFMVVNCIRFLNLLILGQRFWIENSQADQTPYSATYGANHVWEVRLGR